MTKLTSVHSNFVIESCGFIISQQNSILGTPPDALVTCMCCGPGVLEVKCPWCAKDLAISEGVDTGNVPYLEFFSGNLQLKRTHAYYYQCQPILYATERKYCDFVIWTAKPDVYIERITLDNDLIPMMTANAIKFFDYVYCQNFLEYGLLDHVPWFVYPILSVHQLKINDYNSIATIAN